MDWIGQCWSQSEFGQSCKQCFGISILLIIEVVFFYTLVFFPLHWDPTTWRMLEISLQSYGINNFIITKLCSSFLVIDSKISEYVFSVPAFLPRRLGVLASLGDTTKNNHCDGYWTLLLWWWYMWITESSFSFHHRTLCQPGMVLVDIEKLVGILCCVEYETTDFQCHNDSVY